MEELLERLLTECRPYTARGKAADYIPELAKADPSRLGIYVIGANGKENWAGDCRQPFTIQSVIKPILLLQALLDNGEELVRSRVGMEATGKPFDAINASEQSLDSGHINPMVNMGAIVICSLIRGESYEARFQRLLELRNDVGLLAEEYDPASGRQLGNFPQAFSHVPLINTAMHLSAAGPDPRYLRFEDQSEDVVRERKE